MATNFGIDLLVQDMDLVLGANGDFFCTDDMEILLNQNVETQIPFDGYITLRESIGNVLAPSVGEYSQYEQKVGAGASLTISTTSDFQREFGYFVERAKAQLLQDTRIKSVENISYEVIDNSIVNIYVSITISELNQPQDFVFPFAI